MNEGYTVQGPGFFSQQTSGWSTYISCGDWMCRSYATIRETWTTEAGSVCERWWCPEHAPRAHPNPREEGE